MTSRIGGVALNVHIRETEMVAIMTGASQDKDMDSVGTASGVPQDRIFSNSVSQDTDTGEGTERPSDPSQMVPTALSGLCVCVRKAKEALSERAEGVDDIETEAQRPRRTHVKNVMN